MAAGWCRFLNGFECSEMQWKKFEWQYMELRKNCEPNKQVKLSKKVLLTIRSLIFFPIVNAMTTLVRITIDNYCSSKIRVISEKKSIDSSLVCVEYGQGPPKRREDVKATQRCSFMLEQFMIVNCSLRRFHSVCLTV